MSTGQPAQKLKVIGKPRLTGKRFANALVIVAILCIPLMYGGTLTSAYQDPVENIGHIQAAVVNEDTPFTAELVSGTTKTVDVGEMLTDALVNPTEDAGFNWTEMSAAQAEREMADGTVRATLYIPAGLSQQVAQIGTADAAATIPGQLELVTDDGINYLAGTLARTVAITLQDRITSEASEIYSEQLILALGTIRTGMGEAADGSGQLADGSVTLADGLGTLHEGAVTAADGGAQVNAGADALAAGVGQMAGQVPALQDGVRQLDAGAGALAGGAATLDAGINQYTDGVDQVAAGAAQLRAQTPTLQAGVTQLTAGAQQVADGNTQLDEQFHAISDPVAQLAPIPGEVEELVNTITAQVQAEYDRNCSVATPDPILCGVLELVLDKQNEIADAALEITGKAQAAIDGVANAQAAMEALAAGSEQVADGADALKASIGTTSDTAASRTVLGAINGIDGGLRQLAGNSTSLRDGAGQLVDGSNALAAGTGQLAGQVPTLVSGVGQLDAGATTLAGGTGQLLEGLSALSSGSETLVDGGDLIAENTAKLHDALADGYEQIPNYTDSEAEAIAGKASSLISVEPVRENEVANSGGGFAPMFISLALWIGGIAIYLVLPALDRRPGPGETWWMAAVRPARTAAIFAIIQATLAVVITNWAVELHAANVWGMIGIAALASLTFVAVNQACIALMGYRGRFVSIVLLLLQIASMGATFPIETMPGFYRWLHPFIPMTYTQLSLRSLIAGGGTPGIISKTILVLVLWLVVASALVLLGAYLRTKNHPLPYDAALLPDNTPDEDHLSPAERAQRTDLKTEVMAGAAARREAFKKRTLGTVGPRSEAVRKKKG